MLSSLGSLDGGGAERLRGGGGKRTQQPPWYTTDRVSIEPHPLTPLACEAAHREDPRLIWCVEHDTIVSYTGSVPAASSMAWRRGLGSDLDPCCGTRPSPHCGYTNTIMTDITQPHMGYPSAASTTSPIDTARSPSQAEGCPAWVSESAWGVCAERHPRTGAHRPGLQNAPRVATNRSGHRCPTP